MKLKKLLLILVLPLVAITSLALGGCDTSADNTPSIYVVDIKKTDVDGIDDVYTIYYSNGTTSSFTVDNSRVDIQDVYDQYVETYGNISYDDFLKLYLTLGQKDNSQIINRLLSSSVKLYTEFKSIENGIKQNDLYTGSAFIYRIDEDYTYIVTNYHMIYNVDANVNGGKTTKVIGYVYGSEGHPVSLQRLDAEGYEMYDYGNYALELEFIGGSISTDVAVLRIATSAIKAKNDQIIAVTPAKSYYVGETAIAIGNPEDSGLSVTQGILSDDNTSISLDIDNVARSYRSLKIDTPLYMGNSGGGLFNAKGELLGIANAGDTQKQNVNFAIPVDVTTAVADGIIYYYNDNNSLTHDTYKVQFGVTVYSQNAKYVYDSGDGMRKRRADIMVDSVQNGGIAYQMGLRAGDQITSIYIGDVQYNINRSFEISNLACQLRPNDVVKFGYVRDGQAGVSLAYLVELNQLTSVE